MLDLLAPALTPEQGERLTRPAYKQDFREREEAIRDACAGGREATDAVCAVGTPLPAAACGVRAADKGRPAAQVAASEGIGPLPEVVVGAAAPSSKFCTPKRGLRMARSATPTVILSSAGRTTSRRSTRWVKR